MIECSCCGDAATYVLVDYYHEIIGNENVYCSSHAFDNGREKCPCCKNYEIDFEDQTLLPTYPQGTLDRQGCCSDHP